MDALLAVTIDGRWQPGIGDPTWMGWATVAAYFVAAVLCAVFAYRAWSGSIPRWRTHLAFWGGLALFGLVFLVVFILIQAASFHHVDHLLGACVAGMKMNWRRYTRQ